MRSSDDDPIDELQALRTFAGAPTEFWSRYTRTLARLADTERLSILTRSEAEAGGEWQSLGAVGGAWPMEAPDLFAVAETAAAEGVVERRVAGLALAAWEVELGEEDRRCVAVAEKRTTIDLPRLRLAADVPAAYRQATMLRQSRDDLSGFANTLDLLSVLRGRRKFMEAALTLCNELAARHSCHQVALGWLNGRYVVLKALSHRENFDRKMDAAQRIEAAMEEALDQDDEIVWPHADSRAVTHDHQKCAEFTGAKNMVTIPLREGGRLIGAVWLERESPAFESAELQTFRVELDQVAEPMAQLKRRDRWWGARWKGEIEEALQRHWNLSHPWLKLAGVLTTLALIFVFTIPLPYRVEAPFLVRPAKQALLGAPFDGYLATAAIEAGDRVQAGQVLFTLDDATWQMQLAALEADVARFRAEAEQARGQNRMAEMRIAQAQGAQSAAQLEIVRQNLADATARAPFDGIIVEDAELGQRIGAAVARGDVLLRVAQADSLYAELDVPEFAVDDVEEGAGGELAFATRPEDSFPIRVDRVEPSAVAKEAGGVFPARASLVGETPEWMRPGMTGLAKIDAGKRTAWWQFTNRLVDWLRMKLWW